VQSLDAHNTDDCTKNVGLLKVKIDQLRRLIFNMPNCFANVVNVKFGRQRHATIEALYIERHRPRKLSRFIKHCKPRVILAIDFPVSIKGCELWDSLRCDAEK